MTLGSEIRVFNTGSGNLIYALKGHKSDVSFFCFYNIFYQCRKNNGLFTVNENSRQAS